MKKKNKNISQINIELLQNLLFEFRINTNFTFEQMTTNFNKILSLYDIPAINKSTIKKWCNKQHIPSSKYHRFIFMFIQKYAPHLLRNNINSIIPGYRLDPFDYYFNTDIKYEITELVHELLDKIQICADLHNSHRTIYFSLINFYYNLLIDNELLYFTFKDSKYKIIIPEALQNLFLNILTHHKTNNFLIYAIDLYFHRLYAKISRNYNFDTGKFIDKILLDSIIRILGYSNNTDDFEILFFKDYSYIKNAEAPYFKKIFCECINSKFCTNLAKKCLYHYENKIS